VGVLGGLESDPCVAACRILSEAFDRVADLYSRRADALWNRVPGSRLLSGSLSAEDAEKLTDNQGASVDHARRQQA